MLPVVMESTGPSNFYGVIVGVAEGTGVKVGAGVGVGIVGTFGDGEAVGTVR